MPPAPIFCHPANFATRFVVIVELCERFTFYGLTPPFQNYIQNGPNDDPVGYLGMGQQAATGLGDFFQFWYVPLSHPL
jgi:POT family proton-dependent oligopeptide transporter